MLRTANPLALGAHTARTRREAHAARIAVDRPHRLVKDGNPEHPRLRLTPRSSLHRPALAALFLARMPERLPALDARRSVPTNIGGGSTSAQRPTVSITPWQVASVPTGLTATMPATAVRTDSVWGVVTDPEGRAVRFTADHWGQPLKVVAPLGLTTSITVQLHRAVLTTCGRTCRAPLQASIAPAIAPVIAGDVLRTDRSGQAASERRFQAAHDTRVDRLPRHSVSAKRTGVRRSWPIK